MSTLCCITRSFFIPPLPVDRLFRFAAVALAMALSFSPVTAIVANAAAAECADGIDNDRDGRTDYPNDSDCNSRIDNVERPSHADLAVTLTDGEAFAKRGDLLSYTLTIRNNLDEPFTTPVRVTLSNLTYLVDKPSDAVEVDAQTLEWAALNLGSEETKTFSFTARVVDHVPDNSGVVARVVASGTATSTDQTIIRSGALPPPNISLRISDGQTTAAPGQNVTYAIDITNDSTYTAHSMRVSGAIPYLSEFVRADNGGIWDGRNVRWTGIEVAPGKTITLHVDARIRTDAEVGRVLQAGVETLGNTVTDQTTVGGAVVRSSSSSSRSTGTTSSGMPQLVFRAQTANGEALPGDTVSITLSARNTGGSATDNIVVTQEYDPAVIAPIDGGATTVSPGLMTWNVPTLAAGESWQTTITMNVRSGARAGTTNITARVRGDGVSSSESVRTVSMGIVRALPATGAALDLLAVFAAATGALALAIAHRKALRA